MKQYTVRLEIDVDLIELCEIQVNANTKKDAIQIARDKWNENPYNTDFNAYESDARSVSLRDTDENWIAEENI